MTPSSREPAAAGSAAASRPTPPLAADQTLGALVAQASQDLSALVRHEVELAKAEVRLDVRQAAKGGAMFGAAAYLGVLASVLLALTVALFLAWLGLPAWLAFLVVSVVLLLAAGGLALAGKKAAAQVRPPERTLRTSKDTVAFLKHPTRS